jgi:hypothetical protein
MSPDRRRRGSEGRTRRSGGCPGGPSNRTGRHRRREATGGELAVEDRALPENGQSIAQAPQPFLELVAAQPVPPDAVPVAGIQSAAVAEADETSDAVDLRLDDVALGIRNRGPQRGQAVVRDKLGDDRGKHEKDRILTGRERTMVAVYRTLTPRMEVARVPSIDSATTRSRQTRRDAGAADLGGDAPRPGRSSLGGLGGRAPVGVSP